MRSGFAIVPVWVLHDDNLSAYEKLTYACLTGYTNAEGYCFPSHATLAAQMHVSSRTVIRALKKLREAGLVEWQGRSDGAGGQTSNYYKVATQIYPSDLTDLPPVTLSHPLCPSVTPPTTDSHTPGDSQSHELNSINNTQLTRDIPPGQKTPDDTLADFIRAYPKRTMPETITTAWRKALTYTTAETLITAATAYAQSVADTPPRFIKNASTWLNTHSWLDTYHPANTNQQAIWAEIPDDEAEEETRNAN